MSFASIARNIFTTTNRTTAKGKWFQRAGLAAGGTVVGMGLWEGAKKLFSGGSQSSGSGADPSSGMSAYSA